ncbi:uncharacterized protein DNG_00132 [Cephalotrichum gorgonifer]|uniref:Uncharacterized protein n=1 Tax=Cephalotrichum gorgonifer TaxID=2041049 RepID=A0AAE8MNQ9_9PEZI|nr:uncharacterized protein DNG_00132 [Cephalotrichum gorgonifer]
MNPSLDDMSNPHAASSSSGIFESARDIDLQVKNSDSLVGDSGSPNWDSPSYATSPTGRPTENPPPASGNGGAGSQQVKSDILYLVNSFTWSKDTDSIADILENVTALSLLKPTPTTHEYFPRYKISDESYTLPLAAPPSLTSSVEVEGSNTQSQALEVDVHTSVLPDPTWDPKEMPLGFGQGPTSGVNSTSGATTPCNQLLKARHESGEKGLVPALPRAAGRAVREE